MDGEEFERRLALVVDLNANSFDKAAQYDAAIMGLGYLGFFALWAGVSGDVPRWSALASAGLIGASLTAFITWNIVQMLGRHKANIELTKLIVNPGLFDEAFAQRWDAVSQRASRKQVGILSLWAPIFYVSMATGLAGGGLLATVASVQSVKQLFAEPNVAPRLQ